MKHLTIRNSVMAIALSAVATGVMAENPSFTTALTSGKAYGDVRFRYETVDQDNALKDASALTVRTRLGYKTGEMSGFSAVVEFEDSRTILSVDDYNNTLGANTDHSVIIDPETTELDQGYVQYKKAGFTAKVGRQVLTYDNHRFVGHVGWRQDRQTFDAITASYAFNKNLKISLANIEQRNRIFGEGKDIDSNDFLLNASYKMASGKLSGYGYILEAEDAAESQDTLGLRYAGKAKLGSQSVKYAAEYAKQSFGDFDADYMLLEIGTAISGINLGLGYEVLGSDEGSYGFQTPLATLHKFNGWADVFAASTPAGGLNDLYASVAGKLAGGKWKVVYHQYTADESSAAYDDVGSELNLLYAKKFGKHYSAGIKYAAYSADDHAVDTDKLWVWFGAKF